MSTYTPVSNTLHLNRRWHQHSSFQFAKTDNVVPVYLNEIMDIMHILPLAFVQQPEGFTLVTVMGLRGGENLLVSQDHQWLCHYIPAVYRFKPFQMFATQESTVLCIESSMISDSDEGEAFFSNDGQLSPIVQSIMQTMISCNSTQQLQQVLCQVLHKYDLIVPWTITIDDGKDQQPLTGLYRINEDALNALEDQAFLEVRAAGALPVVYAQLLSMNNINHLSRLLSHRVQSETAQPDSEAGTFSFSGL